MHKRVRIIIEVETERSRASLNKKAFEMAKASFGINLTYVATEMVDNEVVSHDGVIVTETVGE